MQTKLLSILKYQNSRIARYIRRNLVTFFFAIFFIIGLFVFGNRIVLTVQESFERGIPLQELLPLMKTKNEFAKEAFDIADAIVVTRARAAEIYPPQLELEVKPEFDPSEDLPF